MSTLDIVVLFLVFALGLKGFLHGFVKEVAGLAAIIGGIFLASRFSPSLADLSIAMFNLTPSTSVTVGSFVVMFATIWIAITFVASILSKAVDMSGMGIADKLLGFAASGGKIFLILSVILFAFSNISLLHAKLQDLAKDSMLYEPMRLTGSFVMKLKPEDLNASAITDMVKKEAQKEVQKEINKSLGVDQ